MVIWPTYAVYNREHDNVHGVPPSHSGKIAHEMHDGLADSKVPMNFLGVRQHQFNKYGTETPPFTERQKEARNGGACARSSDIAGGTRHRLTLSVRFWILIGATRRITADVH